MLGEHGSSCCYHNMVGCKTIQGGENFGRGEKLFGQISKPSLVPNISFNFKDSLCHIEPEGAITTPFFFHYDMHTLMLQFC